MAAREFIELWRSGAHDDAALAGLLARCELSGRMIHGQPDDPGFGKLLSADEWKRAADKR